MKTFLLILLLFTAPIAHATRRANLFWNGASFVNTLSTQFTHASQNSVSFGNNCDQSGLTSFSIDLWGKTNSLTNSGDLFGNYTNASGKGYEAQITTTGEIDWSLNLDGVHFMEVHTAASTFSNNTWHNVAIVSTGKLAANQTIYIDNVSKTLTTVSDTMTTTITNSNICYTGWRASIGADEQVNQITYWASTALSSGNVSSLYNSGVPADATLSGISGLTHYWYMGSGDNATSAGGFIDHAGSANGTGVNTPVFVSDVPH